MYHIMLTDDESLIVDGLYEYLYARRADEYDLIRAYSAQEALDILERKRVDVVVTDIEMPMTSGIDLNEICRRRWPRARTIFLTAHSNFDYIYYSSKAPNTRFILKSEGFGALLEMLDATVEEISRELFTRRLLSGGSGRYNVQTLFAQAAMMRGLLEEELDGSGGLQERLDMWKVPLRADRPLTPVLFRQLSAQSQPDILSLTGYLQEQFGQETTIYPICLDSDTLLLLFQLPGEDNGYIAGICELMQSSLEEFINARIVLAVAGGPLPWRGLRDCVQRLLQTCEYYAGQGESIVCTLSVEAEGDAAGHDLTEIALRRIDRFIEEHYMENLSLSDIAGHVYLSSAYVSRLYKKLRGMNVIDKLQQVRIQNSQRLLAETNQKIQDISELCGFRTARYFISVFRKNTGRSPSQYREEYSRL